jgi:hypothetical protein
LTQAQGWGWGAWGGDLDNYDDGDYGWWGDAPAVPIDSHADMVVVGTQKKWWN